MGKLSKKTEGARPNAENAPFLVDGKYHLRVDRLLYREKTRSGDMFIAEVTVLDVLARVTGKIKRNGKLEDNMSNPLGHKPAWRNKMDNDNGPSNTIEFLAALFDQTFEETEADAEGQDAAVNEDPKAGDVNPCGGMEIVGEFTTIDQKKDPSKSFTRVKWTHVPEAKYLRGVQKEATADKAA